MSKTKNNVIDKMNEQSEKEQKYEAMRQDYNRLSKETLFGLLSAVCDATRELQGADSFEDALRRSDLFCTLMDIQVRAGCFYAKRDGMKYFKMKLHDLLRELYLRMQMFHHYAECKGAGLPGIAHHTEEGMFFVDLNRCAVNLEHSFSDPDREEKGRLYGIGLNVPLLEREDPEREDSHLWDEYDEFLIFRCEFAGTKECRDIYPCEYDHERAIIDILGGLDAIADMNNEGTKK